MPQNYGRNLYTPKELDHSSGHAFLSAGEIFFFNCSCRVDVPVPVLDDLNYSWAIHHQDPTCSACLEHVLVAYLEFWSSYASSRKFCTSSTPDWPKTHLLLASLRWILHYYENQPTTFSVTLNIWLHRILPVFQILPFMLYTSFSLFQHDLSLLVTVWQHLVPNIGNNTHKNKRYALLFRV